MHTHDTKAQSATPKQPARTKKTADATARPAGNGKDDGIHPSLRALPDYPE